MSQMQQITESFRKGCQPPPDWTVSEWSDRRRHLSSVSSAEPGRWNTDRTPYLREPMDCVSDDLTSVITMIFCAQSGKSEAIFNSIGYFIDLDPCPMMQVQPTVEMAEAVSKDRIAPMLRDTPALAGKVAEAKSRDSNNTVRQKQFPGGHLTLVGANAPASLASRPIRVVLADEVDRFPASAGAEGDPVTLAVKRTTTFRHNRKIILTSTPTVKGISRIEKSYHDSDMRKYHVPCPHCGFEQTLEFESIHYDEDSMDGAAILCKSEDCGTLWTEAERLQAVDAGRWIATKPFTGHAGFHLNALYSPWYTMPGIVKEYEESKNDPARYRTFVNTVLADTYADETDHIEEGDILKRMTPISLDVVPEKVLLMTAGIDVQMDRAEIIYLGWSKSQMYILAHEVVHGDPTGDQLWLDLDERLTREFQHELGGFIKIDAVAVDSGNWTQLVYNYCFARSRKRYFAVKGVPGDKPVWELSKSRVKGGRLYLVGVDTAKTYLLRRLRNGDRESPGFIHISEQPEEFVNQLLSEFRELSFLKGFPIYKWHRKPGRRAEVLDATVYGSAVREVLEPDWDFRRERLLREDQQRPKASWAYVAGMYD